MCDTVKSKFLQILPQYHFERDDFRKVFYDVFTSDEICDIEVMCGYPKYTGDFLLARNRYPGYCYCCGKYVPAGYGHFERRWGKPGNKWQIKCVKCASGRTVKNTDPEVQRVRKMVQDNENRNNRR